MYVRVGAIAYGLFVLLLVLPGCGGGSSVLPQVAAPSITTQPTNASVNVGQTATFTVVASGSVPLSYQWQKNDSAIAGATSASYTTPGTAMSDDGSQFKVVVSNSAGSATSNPATLSVSAASVVPSIVQQPLDASVNAGQTATFTVVASGSVPLSYQWQKNDSPIAAATSASYTTPATASSDNGAKFKVVVSNSAGSATSNAVTLTVTAAGSISVTVSPKKAAVAMTTQVQQFTASVSGDSQNLGVSWSVDSIGGGNGTVGSISGGGLYTPPSSGGVHTVTATSIADTGQSASGIIAVTDLSGVFTYRNNLARDGTNPHEYALTSSNVNTTTFGKLFTCTVDGNVYTQPLWVPQLNMNGTRRNVVFVGTEHDSVYAFDAEASPCSTLWHSDLLSVAHGGTAGEIPVPDADAGLGEHDVTPENGITGTPVIDPATNTLYVVSQSEGPTGTFHQRLHALDLVTGNEKFSGPAHYLGIGGGRRL